MASKIKKIIQSMLNRKKDCQEKYLKKFCDHTNHCTPIEFSIILNKILSSRINAKQMELDHYRPLRVNCVNTKKEIETLSKIREYSVDSLYLL